MKFTAAILLKQNVRYAIENGILYFDVQEVKQLHPKYKFPPEKIKQLAVGGIYTDVIKPEDIQEMTDFDKKILQTLNFNPKGK